MTIRTDLVFATEYQSYCFELEQKGYYMHTKAVAESMILEANRKDGLLTAAIRGCTIFGEGNNTLATQIGHARSSRNCWQVGDERNLYDWTYVGNTAHAHILAAKALHRIDPTKPPAPEDGVKGWMDRPLSLRMMTPSHSGTLFEWSVLQLGFLLRKRGFRSFLQWFFYAFAVIAEWSVWLISFGRHESHTDRKVVRYLTINRTSDITKTKDRLDYRPQVSIEEDIRHTVNAYLSSSSAEGKKEH